jgi:hypothetical protein
MAKRFFWNDGNRRVDKFGRSWAYWNAINLLHVVNWQPAPPMEKDSPQQLVGCEDKSINNPLSIPLNIYDLRRCP